MTILDLMGRVWDVVKSLMMVVILAPVFLIAWVLNKFGLFVYIEPFLRYQVSMTQTSYPTSEGVIHGVNLLGMSLFLVLITLEACFISFCFYYSIFWLYKKLFSSSKEEQKEKDSIFEEKPNRSRMIIPDYEGENPTLRHRYDNYL